MNADLKTKLPTLFYCLAYPRDWKDNHWIRNHLLKRNFVAALWQKVKFIIVIAPDKNFGVYTDFQPIERKEFLSVQPQMTPRTEVKNETKRKAGFFFKEISDDVTARNSAKNTLICLTLMDHPWVILRATWRLSGGSSEQVYLKCVSNFEHAWFHAVFFI